MIRTLLVIPIAIAVVLGAGYAGCVAMKYDPHVREMLIAAGACLIASVLAAVPMLLVRGASQAAVAQAGLVGTMVHLFGCAILVGGPMVFIKSLQLGSALVYWVLPLYWLTLIVLVIAFIKAIKAAPVGTTSK